jgi:hypothetical protein
MVWCLGTGGTASLFSVIVAARPLRSADDFALRGEGWPRSPQRSVELLSVFGDEGDDPTEELSVKEAPLDLEGIDE